MTPEARYEILKHRLEVIQAARTSLLPFVRLVHEDPRAPGDARKTKYETAKHHKLLADHLERVADGKLRRLIVTMPPRHGKTTLVTRGFIPWYTGRFPGHSAIMGTYAAEFAGEIGRDVRDIFEHPAYKQVFPAGTLQTQAKSSSMMRVSTGGQVLMRGRGSALTGSGGDIIVIDDPLKNREEADSRTIREKLWTWFTQVVMTRLMTDKAGVIIVQTRWHEDDLVGRLTDPENKCYDATERKKWTVLDLPALARKNDPLGRKEGEALWPKRFGVSYLKSQERLDHRGFNALYQGRPSPDDGAFYDEQDLLTYGSIRDLPSNLRWYMGSDHAVSVEQDADDTCIIPAGLDEEGVLWISPEVWWKRENSMTVVKAMLHLMGRFRPLFWWAEKGHISKSIGPFLRKSMLEEGVHTAFLEIQPVNDKMQRAQSMHGRVSMHMVRFPGFASWWPQARRQILQFPYGAKDDFVDTLSLLGLGLQQQVRPGKPKKKEPTGPARGTLGWVKELAAKEQRARLRGAARAGW